MTLQLDVHGVRFALDGDEETLEELACHFFTYRVPGGAPAGPPHVRVTFERGKGRVDAEGRLRADQILERGLVYNRGPVTWVDYHGAGVSRYDFDQEEGRIVAPAREDLVELGYLMVHSRLGVLLEKRGFFRLHCLGLAVGDRAVLVLAPSGGGKSTLARAALRRPDVSLLGDDLVLIDQRGRVHPFHSPISLPASTVESELGRVRSFHRRHHPPKRILEPASVAHRLSLEPRDAWLVAELRRVSEGPPRLLATSRADTSRALFRDLVIGLGLPQVLELVARHGATDLLRLAPSFVARSRAALSLVARARGAVLEAGDPDLAMALLVAGETTPG